ncbi:MAG: hypothetical protein JWN98_1489 [Abditibacteriota bacterium]|nr:hypothetical protein [Abditibacteriota bacterium]
MVENPARVEAPAPNAPVPPATASQSRKSYFDLFVISFTILFFELACIRWFGSTVIFLTFFTNLVLMACFLGMSVGCLTAEHKRNYSGAILPLTLIGMVLGYVTLSLYSSYSKVTVDVGGQASPQQIFFGTEYRASDPSQIVIPLEVIAGVFFVLIALMFLGLGQLMGRAFNASANRVAAYSADILGSLAGIIAFGLVSYLQTPPLVWFGLTTGLCLYLTQAALSQSRRNIQWLYAIGVVVMASLSSPTIASQSQTFWSPYYKILYSQNRQSRVIDTNNIGHQAMVPIAQNGPAYMLPHLLNRDAGQKPFQDVLIIGAGSGNDVQAARAFGARHIDGVEIDPVIYRLGQTHHPDRPYDDRRVRIHLDDGRSFLKKSDRQYDLIIYALVDSLVLHSGYSSLRLESFLFTREAFQDVKARLKPGGMFAMYNYYRQGWVVARLQKMAGEVFGGQPVVLSLPYQKSIAPSDSQKNHITFILTGNTAPIANALEKNYFWINQIPRTNLALNGYGTQPPPGRDAKSWLQLGPATVETAGVDLLPSDNWPFLYLRDRTIPFINIRGMLLVALLSLAILFVFAPVRTAGAKWQLNWQMFFLGAGFMLLETKGVVHMALLFGSTWVVNSIVFASVLVMILLSNLYVTVAKPRSLWPYYALLIVSLFVSTMIPMSVFLSLPGTIKILASCLITFVPIFFAGIIFAAVFRDSRQPGIDFGSNVAGVILGGLFENFSLVVGFNSLLLIAIAFYVLSALLRPRLRPAVA